MNYPESVSKAIAKHPTTIEGWVSTWEYDGCLSWNNPDYNYTVSATPWWDGDYINIQVCTTDGAYIGGYDKEFKFIDYDVRGDVERYLHIMVRVWPEIMKMIDGDINKPDTEINFKFNFSGTVEQKVRILNGETPETFFEKLHDGDYLTTLEVPHDRVLDLKGEQVGMIEHTEILNRRSFDEWERVNG